MLNVRLNATAIVSAIRQYGTVREGVDMFLSALESLEADARALWAVRVLDRLIERSGTWAEHATRKRRNSVTLKPEYFVAIVGFGIPPRTFRVCGTCDAARVAAAEALTAEDPALWGGL